MPNTQQAKPQNALTTPAKPTKPQRDHSHTVYKTRRQLAVDNLIGGVSWGVGSVIGATFVVAIIGLILAQTQRIPFVGTIIETVITEVEKQQTQRR